MVIVIEASSLYMCERVTLRHKEIYTDSAKTRTTFWHNSTNNIGHEVITNLKPHFLKLEEPQLFFAGLQINDFFLHCD